MFGRTITKRAFKTAALTGSMLALAVVTAQAAFYPEFGSVKISGVGIGNPAIRVISKDGKKWTDVKSGTLNYEVRLEAKMKKGEIYAYWVGNGTEGKYIGEWLDGFKSVNKVISFSATTNSLALTALSAVNACNKLLDQGKNKHEEQKTFLGVPIEAKVKANRGKINPKYRTKYVNGTATAMVFCEAIPKPANNDGKVAQPQDKPGPLPIAKVKFASLKLNHKGGASCPTTATIKASFRTKGIGKVKFRIRRSDGSKSEIGTIISKKKGPAHFRASWTHNFKITKPHNLKYMVEVIGQPKISKWKTLKVKCLGAGKKPASSPSNTGESPESAIGHYQPQDQCLPRFCQDASLVLHKQTRQGHVPHCESQWQQVCLPHGQGG